MSAVEVQAPESQPLRGARALPLWRPFEHRSFRLLFVGECLSAFGSQFSLVAVPELALALSGSWSAFGIVMIAWSTSQAGFLLVGGTLCDRVGPRRLMLASNALGACVVGSYAALVLTGAAQLWHLLVGAVVLGAGAAAFMPSLLALLPLIVREDRLGSGNAVLQGAGQMIAFLGPGPAGLLIATVGLGAAFAFDAGTFVAAFLMLVLMQDVGRRSAAAAEDRAATPELPPHARPRGLLASLREGLVYARSDGLVLPYLVLVATVNLGFFGPFRVGVPSLAHDGLAGGAATLGTLYSALGGGLVLGAAVGGSVGRVRRLGALLVAMALCLGLGLGLLGVVTSMAGAVAAIALMGFASGVANVQLVSWLQVRAEPDFRGRVMSLLVFCSVGMAPFSYAAAGALVDVHRSLLFGAGAALALLAAGCAGLHPAFRARL